jgi:hypothetical protein
MGKGRGAGDGLGGGEESTPTITRQATAETATSPKTTNIIFRERVLDAAAERGTADDWSTGAETSDVRTSSGRGKKSESGSAPDGLALSTSAKSSKETTSEYFS